MELTVGIKGHDEVVVDMSNVASAVGSGALDVFSTPSMIACMERAALSSVMPYMDEGFSTVGIGLEVQHLAATPLGETVRTESELIEVVKNRFLTFDIKSYCGEQLVGTCIHKRCVVDINKFMEKAGLSK
ncbi:MAG: thioesterase family protein [Oscillospiraceae bacterium]|jgi:predicted thioesterase|nr:thioesterase family protein [Oscillospiraceae bacterium]